MKILLVIDYNYSRNWKAIFKSATVKGEKIEVFQSSWKDLIVSCSSNKGCIVKLAEKETPILPQHKKDNIFTPDFLLIRNFPSDLHGVSFKNKVYALMFADIPCVNSLESVYMCSQKPIVYGKLSSIMKKLGGYEKFPLIKQTYYPNIPTSHDDLIAEEKFPIIIKVATVHAGYGKIKINSLLDFRDFQSCMMLNKDYYITEMFCDVDYDLRLQKIGDKIRVYKRGSESSWKKNWGEVYENVKEYPERYNLWIKEVSKLFRGLDLFALDVLKLKDGKEIILELNDTAMGLMFQHEKEDNLAIKEIVLKRMEESFK